MGTDLLDSLVNKTEIEITDYFLQLINVYDPYTAEHCYKVEKLAVQIAKKIGFSKEVLQEISTAALLHDIGKMLIPKKILCKPDKLTFEEFAIMQKHAAIGYKFVRTIPKIQYVAENILYHHECFNGRGYPTRKAGTDIPLISRILTIADVYEAITSDRVYRRALPEKEAAEIILKGKATIFDPTLVDIFFSIPHI